MILLFPNIDTLRLALTSTIVPTEITLAPAAVTFDEQGKIYLESTASLSRTTTKNLDRIGVKGSKRHASDHAEEVSCWPQIVPLTKEPGAPSVSNQAPVLFELSDADDLPILVSEMLRLGNDRQSYRWFAPAPDSDARHVLLRVIGPPYYTLLRAMDESTSGTKGTVRAYLERAPRVWVELGHSHPMAQQIRVADQQLLLLRSPREWIYLEDSPFQDIYDILQFKLPMAPVGWKEEPASGKMSVPLKLTAGNAADAPEFWVLRENAIEQLDTLVRDSDERLMQRLKFAVATDADGKRTVILRTIPSKLAPPALPLEDALGFKPFWKLPNLFVPVGRRLHPTLRRDAVRKLLADDPDQVVWLYPGEGGRFTPESVADDAFRSLEDWVSYVIETDQKPLAAWIEATRFDFDHFICKETPGPKNKPDKGDKDKTREDSEDARAAKGPFPPKGSAKPKPPGVKLTPTGEQLAEPEKAKPPSEWIKRRTELEEQFKSIEGPLDAPERQALWVELARANAGAEDAKTEAAICWLNALWGTDPLPIELLSGWLRTEAPGKEAITAEEFDQRLAQSTNDQEEPRALIASFLWLAAQCPVPAWLPARLPAVQAYLERHETTLPVRAIWLAGYRLAQLSGNDVLGLARVRDRLLQRLLQQGLTAERDLPMFLRVAGRKDSERLRMVNEKALELHAAIRKWTEHIPVNLPYVDLFFAFALAKLGESTKSRRLLEDARRVMEIPIPISRSPHEDQKVTAAIVSNFLYKAFKYRIEQALLAKPHAGQLADDVLAELDEIYKKGGNGPANNPYKLANYVISRLRDQSRILEPHEKLDPYSEYTKGSDALKKELADLHATRNPTRLADQIRKLYKNGLKGRSLKDVQFFLLHDALPISTRVGEAFAVEMIQLVPGVLAAGSDVEDSDLPKKQGELLERAMFLAGHFDRGDLIKKLVDGFTELIRSKSEDARFKLINAVAGQCLRSLKKLGMSDEIDRFLGRLRSEVLRGAPIPELKKKYAAKPDMWGAVLQTLQNLAAGWLTFGMVDQAMALLNEARNELLHPTAVKLEAKDYTPLARAYVTACGQCPSDTGLAHITELFRKMDPTRITNTWTTSAYYSRFHLNLVEDVVQAIVSDDFALGPSGRRWLDDDEYLVRRRIHADMRRERAKSGV
jgi:hypothetical protein